MKAVTNFDEAKRRLRTGYRIGYECNAGMDEWTIYRAGDSYPVARFFSWERAWVRYLKLTADPPEAF